MTSPLPWSTRAGSGWRNGVAKGWTIGGVGDPTREAASAAAQEAGLPLGAWVERVVREVLQGEPEPGLRQRAWSSTSWRRWCGGWWARSCGRCRKRSPGSGRRAPGQSDGGSPVGLVRERLRGARAGEPVTDWIECNATSAARAPGDRGGDCCRRPEPHVGAGAPGGATRSGPVLCGTASGRGSLVVRRRTRWATDRAALRRSRATFWARGLGPVFSRGPRRCWGLDAPEPAEQPSEQQQDDHRRYGVPDAPVDPVHEISPDLLYVHRYSSPYRCRCRRLVR